MAKRTPESNQTEASAKVVNCKNLRIRQTPSLEAKVLEYVPEGETLTVNEAFTNATFARVRTVHGTKGYAARAYLEMQ